MKRKPVQVVLRLRPPLSDDIAVTVTSKSSVAVKDSTVYSSPFVSDFRCDHVVDSHEDMHLSLPQNGNVIIIAYGHSGTGKTYSIFGPGGALDSVLPHFSSANISFAEVYNERVYDLLVPGHPLPVMEDRHKQVVVKNLTVVQVTSPDELNAIVELGMANRMVSENAVHAFSSRSHAILQIKTQARSVWLVDLAGSERINPNYPTSSASRSSSIEVTNIHKSLHALRRCISALKSPKTHLPARSSVLTRLLFSQSVAKCVLVACVSPDSHLVQETLSTLDFASAGLSASTWDTKPERTQTETELLRYALAKLRHELQIEKARRIQLEREMNLLSSRSSTPAIDPGKPQVGTIMKLNNSRSVKRLYTDESVLPPGNESIKCSPVLDRTLEEHSVVEPCSVEDSVLSQTWRHNQYDAILRKCWQL